MPADPLDKLDPNLANLQLGLPLIDMLHPSTSTLEGLHGWVTSLEIRAEFDEANGQGFSWVTTCTSVCVSSVVGPIWTRFLRKMEGSERHLSGCGWCHQNPQCGSLSKLSVHQCKSLKTGRSPMFSSTTAPIAARVFSYQSLCKLPPRTP